MTEDIITVTPMAIHTGGDTITGIILTDHISEEFIMTGDSMTPGNMDQKDITGEAITVGRK